MNAITGLTDAPKQDTSIVLADGTKVTLSLEYRPNQRGWFYGLAREDFSVSGMRLVASPNLLRQYRNLIPFGIAVATRGGVEPLNQTDLLDGTATLLLLSAAEVDGIEATIYPGS